MVFFFGLVAMFDLRLLGWIMPKVPLSEVLIRLLPLTVAAFVIMLISGSLLFYAIPLRSYQNIFFRFKMILLLLAGFNVWLFHSRVYPKLVASDVDALPPQRALAAAAAALRLWVRVVVPGRVLA